MGVEAESNVLKPAMRVEETPTIVRTTEATIERDSSEARQSEYCSSVVVL